MFASFVMRDAFSVIGHRAAFVQSAEFIPHVVAPDWHSAFRFLHRTYDIDSTCETRDKTTVDDPSATAVKI